MRLTISPTRAAAVAACLALGVTTLSAQTTDTTAARVPEDTVGANLIPPGYGTLRQDDIALKLQPQGMGIMVRVIPLDESVIRLLSPDSYRALRDLLESRRTDIDSRAKRINVQAPAVWYVSFYGLQNDARFTPTDLIINSNGRDFRPVDVIPLSPGFGEQRLRQREVQSALLLYDHGVDVSQPLEIAMQDERNQAWGAIVRRVERERAMIRARMGKP